jgi:hypothetical protein
MLTAWHVEVMIIQKVVFQCTGMPWTFYPGVTEKTTRYKYELYIKLIVFKNEIEVCKRFSKNLIYEIY